MAQRTNPELKTLFNDGGARQRLFHRDSPCQRPRVSQVARSSNPLSSHVNIPMARKKSKRPFKFLVARSLGIPTNIAVGPLGFQAVLDVNPEGKQIDLITN